MMKRAKQKTNLLSFLKAQIIFVLRVSFFENPNHQHKEGKQ